MTKKEKEQLAAERQQNFKKMADYLEAKIKETKCWFQVERSDDMIEIISPRVATFTYSDGSCDFLSFIQFDDSGIEVYDFYESKAYKYKQNPNLNPFNIQGLPKLKATLDFINEGMLDKIVEYAVDFDKRLEHKVNLWKTRPFRKSK